ncbi:O-antigen ligase family protein [Altererythrobacter sp. Z27]|uniref:O-antigen ligase family protein n=1 Tax=Altererythrobacter sp. Z27 TaxID=3461147 RepID=UPI004044E880
MALALPIIQSIALPPQVWQALPGRSLVTEALAAAELPIGWRPISLDPARTLLAALGLILPLTLLTLGWQLRGEQLVRLAWFVVALGLLHVAWGIPQVLSQGETAIFYRENPMPGVLFGGFANRNSTGLFLAVCLLFALTLKLPDRLAPWTWLLRIGFGSLFSVAIILTQSRSGIALGLVALAIVGSRHALSYLSARRQASGNAMSIALLAFVGAALVAAALAFVPGSRVEDAFDRFGSGDGQRAELWEDAAYSARRYWPVGSGMGTFDEVFQLDESLEHLSLRKAGRAHNEYLELAIEGGLPALLLAIAWILLVASFAVRARKQPGRWTAWVGGAALLMIALQSTTDYPFRSQAMLAMAALAMLLLGRFSEPAASETT